jgi:hypothetical protein
LFTFAHAGETSARFVDTVLHASQRANSTLHVVVTLRVDFFGLCSKPPEFWTLLTQHQYLLTRMAPDCLRDAIEKPMSLAGLQPAPGLVDTVLADVGAQPGGLALLEHALDRLWKTSGGRQPMFEDYETIGRLKGAIQKHADDVMANKLTSDGQRDMARRIFVALTALGEGTEDSARRAAKQDLLALPGEDAAHVLEVLADERLVTVGDAEDKESVGIAHEALIREWPKLRGWVDGHRADIRFQRELEESWRAWRSDNPQVLRGGRLEDAVRWVRKNPGARRQEVWAFVEDESSPGATKEARGVGSDGGAGIADVARRMAVVAGGRSAERTADEAVGGRFRGVAHNQCRLVFAGGSKCRLVRAGGSLAVCGPYGPTGVESRSSRKGECGGL